MKYHSDIMLRNRSSSKCSAAAARPEPMPYQPGKTKRACVQENTHGMARKDSMPALLRRDAGREPIRMRSIRSIGVALLKYL